LPITRFALFGGQGFRGKGLSYKPLNKQELLANPEIDRCAAGMAIHPEKIISVSGTLQHSNTAKLRTYG
jgi:hypothetical protein